MLLELTIGNYRSFKEDVTLSLVASKLKSRDRHLDVVAQRRLSDDLSVLHTAAIYGANASGKSNVVLALEFALSLIRDSAREGQAGDPIPAAPFLFHEESRSEPTYFELVFLHDGVQYRYGFEVDREKVHREWLFKKIKREVRLLERAEQSIQLFGDLKREGDIAHRTRANALFLSVAAQLDVALATHLFEWFRSVGIITGLADSTAAFTAKCIDEGTFGGRVEDLLRALDVGILDFEFEERRLRREDLPDELPDTIYDQLSKRPFRYVKTVHPVFDDTGAQVEQAKLDIHEESAGTQRLFALVGPIVDTLTNGHILVVDEFDARLHPLVSRRLVELFHDPETNPRHAQLIITTHDTNLLTRELFRRDQVWFVEKDKRGESTLYSLASFHVRNDASFEADYFRGRYGAVPFLGGLRRVLATPDPEPAEVGS